MCLAILALATLAGLAGWHAAPGDAALAVAPCRASALSASFGGQGATESLLGAVDVINRGHAACRLSGRPAIALPGGSPGEVLRERAMDTSAMFPGTRFSSTLVLGPGRAAAVRFQWANWCSPRATGPPGASAGGRRPSRVLVRIAGDAHPIVASVSGGLRSLYLPVCNDPAAPSSLLVSLWIAARG